MLCSPSFTTMHVEARATRTVVVLPSSCHDWISFLCLSRFNRNIFHQPSNPQLPLLMCVLLLGRRGAFPGLAAGGASSCQRENAAEAADSLLARLPSK